MNVKLTKSKLASLNDCDLDILLSLVKKEYINRGKVDSQGNIVSNFTSNTTHSEHEQAASLSEMFDRAWIHG